MTIWNPKLEVYPGPRYKALADAIAADIKAGNLKPRQKLPTHRFLAEQLGVTVGTVTRGYAEAEKRELVEARMGSGTFVSGKTSGMSDYLQAPKVKDDVIDMSLSITLGHGQEEDLSILLNELSRNPKKIKSLIGYQFKAGTEAHREVMGRWLKGFGIETKSDNLVICNGGQNAIHTVLQALTHEGDRVVSGEVTYPGFTYLARHHRLRHFGVEMDDQGLIPDSLEEICQKHQPKILYCMPNLQNPTSITLPLERREKIIKLANRYNFFIIEDQVQGLFHSNPLPFLYQLDPSRVFFSTSFSKIFAGGLRIGLIVVPTQFLNAVVSTIYLNCLFAPSLLSEAVCMAIENGGLQKMLEIKRKEIGQRQRIAEKILYGYEIINHPECPHTWLKVPEPWLADELVLQLQKDGILVKAESAFAVGAAKEKRGIRICLSGIEDQETVERGLRIIRNTLEQHPGVCQSII